MWFPVMNYLEDSVLFRSSDCSISISAKEFAGFYFTDDAFDEVHADHPGLDAGIIYDLEDDTLRAVRDFHGYPKIFWPPPGWLEPTE